MHKFTTSVSASGGKKDAFMSTTHGLIYSIDAIDKLSIISTPPITTQIGSGDCDGDGCSNSNGGCIDSSRSDNDGDNHSILTRLKDVNWALDSVICDIQQKLRQIRVSNRTLVSTYDTENVAHVESLYIEHVLSVMLNVLRTVRLISTRPHHIPEMSLALLPVLYVVRMASTYLHNIGMSCSQKLYSVSISLGSIILDVAIMSSSKIDLGESNKSASILFDNAKLTATFDLKKRYPKLDISGACSRCY